MKRKIRWFFLVFGVLVLVSCGGKGTSGTPDEDVDEDAVDDEVAGEDLVDEDIAEDDVGVECGNGEVDEGEECDDGNDAPGDGCESDCTFTCTGDGDCDDGLACTDDVCNTDSHMCSHNVSDAATVCRPAVGDCDIAETCDGIHQDCPADEAMAQGDVCLADPRRICLDGTCAASECGDGWVDTGAGESCEPPGAGSCNENCRWTCDSDADCPDDGNPCNGEEYCDTGAHQCDHRNAPDEGYECQADPRRICIAWTCQASTCGDGYLDTVESEECDDGNDVSGDGCEPATCLFSCHADTDCADGLICNGNETCDTASTHTCQAGTNADAGTACDDGLYCTATDECDGSGACAGAGNPCADSLSCTINETCSEETDGYSCLFDVASGTCLIDGACHADGAENPSNPCQSCQPSLAADAWSSVADGTACGDGMTCRAGVCALAPCEAGLQCTDGVVSGDESDIDCGGATCHRCGAGQTCTDDTDCVSGVCSAGLCVATTLTALSVGGGHSCALTGGGGVMCWGRNDFGQLGDGTTLDRTVATEVVGLSSGVAAVSAGYDHTCAVTSAGAVKCWGSNASGQLGDAATTDRLVPTDVSGLSTGAAMAAAGGAHTCAVTDAGAVKCWGSNASGQLGDDTTTDRLVPTDVSGLSTGVAMVSAGGAHTCVVTDVGTAKCWGDNGSGRLGDGTNTDRLVPTDVTGLSGLIVAVGAGELHTCSHNSVGEIRCWGENGSGQLGDNTNTDRWTPVRPVSAYADAIAVGGRHTCHLRNATQQVACWGESGEGQIGTGFLTDLDMAAHIVGFDGAVALAAGRANTCAIMSTGAVMCTGANYDGQIGDGTKSSLLVPVTVPDLASGVAAVAAGGYHTCALTEAGAVTCWGRNSYGQLGSVGGSAGRATPVVVTGLESGVAAVAAGLNHTCALTDAGGVKCWGLNVSGQLGNGFTGSTTSPVDVVGLASGVVALALGELHSCALTDAGGIKCWGGNTRGQLGDGTLTQRLTPVDVSGLTSGVVSITAGNLHTCAVTDAGGAKCWGTNLVYELGDGTNIIRTAPVDVFGLTSGVAAVAAGSFHTCALLSTGGAKCWGFNESGQVGDGSRTGRSTPVDVFGLASGGVMLAGGGSHTCALMSSASALCWGDGSFGQLGRGTEASSNRPVDVCDVGSILMLDTGDSHSCAVMGTGAAMCWGSNRYGQLGEPLSGPKNAPVDMLL